MKIRSTSDALKAIEEIADLFKSGQVTQADFENFRNEIEPHIKIMEEIALEKNRKIIDYKEKVKNTLKTLESKKPETTKFKAAINKAMEILP